MRINEDYFVEEVTIIPDDELKEAYHRIYYGCRDKGVFTRNVLEVYDVLNDNFQYTEELETTIKQLKNIYGMYDWQVQVVDPNDIGEDSVSTMIKYKFKNSNFKPSPNDFVCKVVIPNFKTVKEEIVEFMKSRGYVLITQNIENSIVGDEVLMWQNLYFVPKNQTDITEELSNYNVFYHISPLSLLPQIKKHGFIPQARTMKSDISKDIEYAPRIYFFTERYSKRNVALYKKTLSPNQNTPYLLYTLDAKKLTSTNRFYYDPLFGKEAVFTTTYVPFSYVIDVEQI